MADQGIDTIEEENNSEIAAMEEQELDDVEDAEGDDEQWSEPEPEVSQDAANSATSNRMPSQLSKARLSRMSTSTRHDEDESASSGEDEDEDHSSVLITEVKDEDANSQQVGVSPGRITQIRLRRTRKKRTGSGRHANKPEEEEWDTDLENEAHETYKGDADHGGDPDAVVGEAAYMRQCEKLGVVPVSYFQRHIEEPEIVMRYHGLGPQGTQAIAKVLKENLTLERLNLTGNWMEAEGAFYMSRMLNENDYITELSLAENKLGSAGIVHVAKMLCVNSGLRKLDLSNNGFTDKDAALLSEALEEWLSSEALEQNKFLRELNLSYNHFGSDTGEIFGPAIGGNDILDAIDLSWNQIRKKGAVCIARGLKENIRLKVINLAWNGLGADGGAAIGDAIGVNETLQEIDISGNRIDAHAAMSIAKGLRKNEDLLILRMGNNPITTKGAIDIAQSLSDNESSQLNCLDLSEVPVESELLRLCEAMATRRGLRLRHGPSLRSGNTPDDIGKPAVDPFRREPLLVLREHIFQHDVRVLEVLERHDADHSYSVPPAAFTAAMQEIAAPLSKDQVDNLIIKLDVNKDGKVFYGDIFKQMENSALQAQERGYMGFVPKTPNMHSRNQSFLNNGNDGNDAANGTGSEQPVKSHQTGSDGRSKTPAGNSATMAATSPGRAEGPAAVHPPPLALAPKPSGGGARSAKLDLTKREA